jgi:uncharacterized glyoxalase superfamily protein PhnB
MVKLPGVTGIQPELWVDRVAEAIAFYAAAFGARCFIRGPGRPIRRCGSG